MRFKSEYFGKTYKCTDEQEITLIGMEQIVKTANFEESVFYARMRQRMIDQGVINAQGEILLDEAEPVQCPECRGQGRVLHPLNVTDDGFMACNMCGGEGVLE